MENGSYLQYNSPELLKTRMRRRWCEEGGQMVAFFMLGGTLSRKNQRERRLYSGWVLAQLASRGGSEQ